MAALDTVDPKEKTPGTAEQVAAENLRGDAIRQLPLRLVSKNDDRLFTGGGDRDISTVNGAATGDNGVALLKKAEAIRLSYDTKVSGATIGRDSDNTLSSILRKDHSKTVALRDGDRNLIIESSPSNKDQTVWAERSNPATGATKWVSNENPPRERQNYKLESNGNVSYEEGGKRHIVRGDGTNLQEDPKRPIYNFDDGGRIQWVAYPNGKDLLGFNYKDGTNEPLAVYSHDRSTGKSTPIFPDGKSSEAKIGPDGTFHSVRYTNFESQTVALKDVRYPDGRIRSEEISARGCVATRDESHKVLSVNRPDGISLSRNKTAEGNEEIVVAQGDRSLTWTRDASGIWNSPGKPARTGLNFDSEGNLTWDGSPKPVASLSPAADILMPKEDRKEQREINKGIKEVRKGFKGDGPISSNDEDVAAARASLEEQLKKVGHLDSARVILNELEANTLEARKLHERMNQFPPATNLAERLDLKHYDTDAVPSNARVADAYRQAAAALEGQGVGPCQSEKARAKMVIEGLRNIADVTGIDQGQYTTCGPASGEKYIAARRPDEYMNGLRQLIQTGAYTAPHGNAFNYNALPAGSWLPAEDSRRTLRPDLTPGNEEKRWDYKNEGRPNRPGNLLRVQDGQRNWASQAWQNLFLANARQSYQSGQIPDGITCRMQVGNAIVTVPSTTFRHIEDFTTRVTGTPMTTIGQQANIPSAANLPWAMDDRLAARLQYSGRYPVLDWVGPHWFTDNGAQTLPNGQVSLHTDNQWGRAYDPGWRPVGVGKQIIESAIASQQGSAR